MDEQQVKTGGYPPQFVVRNQDVVSLVDFLMGQPIGTFLPHEILSQAIGGRNHKTLMSRVRKGLLRGRRVILNQRGAGFKVCDVGGKLIESDIHAVKSYRQNKMALKVVATIDPADCTQDELKKVQNSSARLGCLITFYKQMDQVTEDPKVQLNKPSAGSVLKFLFDNTK